MAAAATAVSSWVCSSKQASGLLLVTVDGSHQISRVASEGDTNLASDSDYSTTSFELQFAVVKNGFMHSDQ